MLIQESAQTIEEKLLDLVDRNVRPVKEVLITIPAFTPGSVFENGYWVSPQQQRARIVHSIQNVSRALRHLVNKDTSTLLMVQDRKDVRWTYIPEDAVSSKKTGLPGIQKSAINFQKASEAAVAFALGFSYSPEESKKVGNGKIVIKHVAAIETSTFSMPYQEIDVDTTVFVVSGNKLNNIKVEGWADRFSPWAVEEGIMEVPYNCLKSAHDIINLGQYSMGSKNCYSMLGIDVMQCFMKNGWACFDYEVLNDQTMIVQIQLEGMDTDTCYPRSSNTSTFENVKRDTIATMQMPSLIVDYESGLVEYKEMV